MQYWISAGILWLTLSALLYKTKEVWPKDAYETYISYNTRPERATGI